MRKFVFLLILLSVVTWNTAAYDPQNPSPYKSIRIEDISNIPILNSYNYTVFVNGNYVGTYAPNQEILVSDNSDVVIYVPSPISMNTEQSYEIGKTVLTLGLMYFVGGIGLVLLIILAVAYFFFWRKK